MKKYLTKDAKWSNRKTDSIADLRKDYAKATENSVYWMNKYTEEHNKLVKLNALIAAEIDRPQNS